MEASIYKVEQVGFNPKELVEVITSIPDATDTGKLILEKLIMHRHTDERTVVCVLQFDTEDLTSEHKVSFSCSLPQLNKIAEHYEDYRKNFSFNEKGFIYSTNIQLEVTEAFPSDIIKPYYTVYSSEERDNSLWKCLTTLATLEAKFIEVGVDDEVCVINNNQITYNPNDYSISYRFYDSYGEKETFIMSPTPELALNPNLTIGLKVGTPLRSLEKYLEPIDFQIQHESSTWEVYHLNTESLTPIVYDISYYTHSTFIQSVLECLEDYSLNLLKLGCCAHQLGYLEDDSVSLSDYLRKMSDTEDGCLTINMEGCLLNFKELLEKTEINNWSTALIQGYNLNLQIQLMKIKIQKIRFLAYVYGAPLRKVTSNKITKMGALIS